MIGVMPTSALRRIGIPISLIGFVRGSPESVDTLIELILLVCPASLAAM